MKKLVSLQTLETQVAAPLQLVQTAPPIPQAAVALPVWQLPEESQHPAQLWAQPTVPPPPPDPPPLPPPEPPPVPATQTLLWQDWPLMQTAQDLAMVPHAAAVVPL